MEFDTTIKFQLKYIVKKINFRSEESGRYCIDIKVLSMDGYPRKTGFPRELTAWGFFPALYAGDTYESTAKFHENPQSGYSFNLLGYPEEVMPSTAAEVAKYLSSHIRGLGLKGAENIVSEIGASAITEIAKDPSCLDGIKNLTAKKKKAIAEWCEEHGYFENLILFLHQHGIPASAAKSLYERYGNLTIARLIESPYDAYESGTVSFRYAEKLASNLGLPWNDPKRLVCAVRAAIDDRIGSHGDTCVLQQHVIGIAEKYIAKSKYYDASLPQFRTSPEYIFNESDYEKAVDQLIKADELIPYQRSQDNGGNLFYYRKETYFYETESAKKTIELMKREPVISTSPVQIRRFLESQNLGLVDEQIKGVIMAASSGISILTGGPGTGKTYTMQGLIRVLKAFKPNIKIVQAAPTAKAAAKMREVTKLDADTIHSVFKITAFGGGNEDFKLDADYLIIDESSMIGAELYHTILRRISENVRVLLVGDAAQLPSIDCGDVLNHLCISATVPVTELKQVHRQSQTSAIVRNAHRIRSKSADEIRNLETDEKDFKIIESRGDEDAADYIVNTVMDLVARKVDLQDILVLTPVHATSCGTDALNTRLQALLNPPIDDGKEFVIDDMKAYHVRDRVINTKNFKTFDTEGGSVKVKNGDVGYIKDINGAAILVDFDSMDNPIWFTKGEIDNLDLAYALTVHKSQGSEADYVIMPCINDRKHLSMMKNALIYTAVTRAKRLFLAVGRKDIFVKGCLPEEARSLSEQRLAYRNQETDIRTSLFFAMLRKYFRDEFPVDDSAFYL